MGRVLRLTSCPCLFFRLISVLFSDELSHVIKEGPSAEHFTPKSSVTTLEYYPGNSTGCICVA